MTQYSVMENDDCRSNCDLLATVISPGALVPVMKEPFILSISAGIRQRHRMNSLPVRRGIEVHRYNYQSPPERGPSLHLQRKK
jgi:hypothetical protein